LNPKSTFSDTRISGAKGRCPRQNFTTGRGWSTVANAYLPEDWSAPNNYSH